MRKPSVKNLKINEAETRRMRKATAHHRSIKITININEDTLKKLKLLAEETGIPYQRLINRTLAESLASQTKTDSRLDKVERELAALKKRIE
jgi:predicted DNA binding CopG/RHH family protein